MTKNILKYLLPAAIWTVVISLCAFDKKQDDVNFIIPDGWPRPAYNLAGNMLTSAGFQLGRQLFFDPVLSRDGTVSCASCHVQVSGFAQAGHSVSNGIKGLKGIRNAPALMNLAWNTSFMWDGGVNNLEVQPLAPITNPAEMNNTLENVVSALSASPIYRSQFHQVFGDSTITGQRVLKALAQYMVMFESFNSKYDRYVRQEPGGGLSAQELHGLKLFRANCESCHNEPLFTNNSFQNTGLTPNTAINDMGRMKITQDFHDSLRFKVPTLRNIAASYPYMHDGRFGTLMQVLDHYTDGVVQSPSLAKELRKHMRLSPGDKQDIIAFLQTLTDNEFLNDRRLNRSAALSTRSGVVE